MESSSQSSDVGLVNERQFVCLMLKIYRDAARIQYEEAEELIATGLAARASADAIMARCADLVVETLDPEGLIDWPPAEVSEDGPIPF
jgi:hypothetical protein